MRLGITQSIKNNPILSISLYIMKIYNLDLPILMFPNIFLSVFLMFPNIITIFASEFDIDIIWKNK